MVFFIHDPFDSDPFFSDSFRLNLNPYSNVFNKSVENCIYNTLDNIFSNSLIEPESTVENKEDKKHDKKQDNKQDNKQEKKPDKKQENKSTNNDNNQVSKEMSISDWINKYKVFHPSIDISEGEKNYMIHADLPGMKKEDVKLDLTDDSLLTISGERKNEIKESSESNQSYRIERNFGKFKRSFQLPDNADLNNIQAKMENGVLEININKKELPKKETHQILIQ